MLPKGANVHHESTKTIDQYFDLIFLIIVELGVVIGQGGRDISKESAMDHVMGLFKERTTTLYSQCNCLTGYALAIDLTARDIQAEAKSKVRESKVRKDRR